jgi:type II secretion system protein D
MKTFQASILSISAMLVLGSSIARAVDPPPEINKGTAEKTVTFNMRDKPWASVLEWLSDQTGLPIIYGDKDVKPQGTFNFIAPKNGPKTYTIPKVIDILNEQLLGQNLILIRRAASFTLVPADKKINPAILPRLRIEDLDHHGETEIAQVLVQLKALNAEDVVSEIKEQMGPFGAVSAIAQANQLVLQDTVGSLKLIIAAIKNYEENEKGQVETYHHKCVYIKATEAARILKELLGDPRELMRLQQPQQQPFGFPFGGGGGGRFAQMFQPPGQQGAPQQGAPQAGRQQAANTPKIRMHYITVDERLNTVFVSGPANKTAQAKAIMDRIDVQQKGQAPVLIGQPSLVSYSVSSGSAEALANVLKETYKDRTNVRIVPAGSNAILVWGDPEDQIEIGAQILKSGKKDAETKVIKLGSLDATKTAETLKGMFGDAKDPKSGAPFIEADTGRNAIVVKGTPAQVKDVTDTLDAMGEVGGSAEPGKMRVYTIDKGSAAALAEALEKLLPQMRKNPVKVVVPSSENKKPEPIKEPSKEPPPQEEGGDEVSDGATGNGHGPQLVDPQEKKRAEKEKPGNEKPIHIIASGNRLLVTSDDPEALRLVQELIRLYTEPSSAEGEFEVIKLENANAADVAKILDEAYNGVKSQPTQQVGFPGFFNQFGGRNAMPAPSTPSTTRIRVVADPATNSLLVRASPLDMLSIRRLIEKNLDAANTKSKAQSKSWVIEIKNTSAAEVANVLKEVYREHINNNPSFAQGAFPVGGRRFGFGGLQNLNLDANGNPRAVDLSIGVDDRSNRLIVTCTEAMYKEIETLVKRLDDAAKDSTRTVRVISTKNIDPLLIQQAIDAIQGRRTVRPATGTLGGTSGTGIIPFGQGGGAMSPFQGGGGQFQGGGGGRGGGGGGNRGGPPGSGGGIPPRSDGGSDFFDYRVKDDPRASVLYDPRPAPENDESHLDGAEEQQPPPGPQQQIQSPRQPVIVEPLEQSGMIVISGNAADVEEVIRIIEYLQKLGAGAEVNIELVPLQVADATSVANTLTQLYQRVVVGATANIAAPGPARTTATGPGGQQIQTTQQQAASVVLLPIPRLNAILVAAPKARIKDITDEIKRLDVRPGILGQTTPIPLKKASASRVATLVQNFYAQRYPGETAAQHQIRVTYDDSTNTVFVQAAPGDLAEIRSLIDRIDTTVSSAVNELRIYHLRNALADELAALLQQAITQGVVTPTTPPAAVPGAGAGAAPGAVPAGAAPGVPQAAGVPGAQPTGVTTAAGRTTKTTTLRFINPRPGAPGVIESGFLEDVHINSDIRTNSLIISAPAKSMDLLFALIRELDQVPVARAEVNIFHLKKSDATTIANMLQQLFFGTGGVGGARPTTGGLPGAPTPVGGGGLGAPGGALGGLGAAGAALGAAGAAGGVPRPVYTLPGIEPTEGASLIQLSITPDVPSNSIIVAGSRNDLDVITALISRLETAADLQGDIRAHRYRVYRVKNVAASDLATSLQTFLNNSLTVLNTASQSNPFQVINRDVIVVAEPISNSLLISATPRYYDEVIKLVEQLDIQPPQVTIQVLVAEVDLNNSEEFGVEIGLQSPILFQRSVIPAPGFFGGGTSTFTTPASGTSLVPGGVTVSSTINPAALPGFAFNNTGPLGNNPVVGPGIVGFQGLGNLGVGRVSPTSNVGGFVFSAGSDAFNLLIRALKTQGRIDVLSRPQITVLDNQNAFINVGQEIPIITSSNVTPTGVITTNIDRRNVGVLLNVTPKIYPDGSVLLRVVPEVSRAEPIPVSLGNGQLGTVLDIQHMETTVLIHDGETVAIGGLIARRDAKSENKIPVLGDLPFLGAAFRYRTESKTKTELLLILTPRIIRAPCDADQILAIEEQRINWSVPDVLRTHGTTGVDWLYAPGLAPGGELFDHSLTVPPPGQPASAPGAKPEAPILPPPRALPGPSPGPAATPTMPDSNPSAAGVPSEIPAPTEPAPLAPSSLAPTENGNNTSNPSSPGKESGKWRLFQKH